MPLAAAARRERTGARDAMVIELGKPKALRRAAFTWSRTPVATGVKRGPALGWRKVALFLAVVLMPWVALGLLAQALAALVG